MMAHGVLDMVRIFKADGPPLPSVTVHNNDGLIIFFDTNNDGLINRELVVWYGLPTYKYV
jgi:hypothetical protein